MTNDLYSRLRFLYKVDYIQPDVEERQNYDSDLLWLPNNSGNFDTVYSTGWLQRTPERVVPVQDPGGSDFSVCSLLYRSSTSYFFAKQGDCRASEDNALPWRRIRFNHDERRNLSIATFYGNSDTLAGRGSLDWVPELLPSTYNRNHSSNIPYTHFAGDLGLIVGLIAFSCPRERDVNCLIDTMQRCFQPPRWVRRHSQAQRIDRHGVVVTIRVDPEAGDPLDSKRDLLSFQSGQYGAILRTPECSRQS